MKLGVNTYADQWIVVSYLYVADRSGALVSSINVSGDTLTIGGARRDRGAITDLQEAQYEVAALLGMAQGNGNVLVAGAGDFTATWFFTGPQLPGVKLV